jgi:hypothetical protein
LISVIPSFSGGGTRWIGDEEVDEPATPESTVGVVDFLRAFSEERRQKGFLGGGGVGRNRG